MLGVVSDILRRRAGAGWLVGGSVRDRLLGRYSPDLDVVVADDAEAVAGEVAATLRIPWFALSDRYPTYRVLGPDGHVDVAAVRGEDILADLAERDFTVNALAVPVESLAAVSDPERGSGAGLPEGVDLIDPFGGVAHLRERRLVAVSDHIFTDDPLRLMRAPRFCHTLGLEMDADLTRSIKQQAADLDTVAVERVVSEACITLAAGRSAEAARLWDDLGLLTAVLGGAEVSGGGVDRAATYASLERLDECLDRPGEWFPETAEFLETRLDAPVDGAVTRPVALRLAALTSLQGTDGMRALARRLKVSGTLASLMVASARCRLSGRDGAEAESPPTLDGLLPDLDAVGREAVLFLWDAGRWGPEIVMLAAASEGRAPDGRAPGGGPVADGGAPGTAAQRLMRLAVQRAQGEAASLPMDGEDLMRELGLESGPVVGRALREARLAWESGEVTTREEALAVARRAAW